MTEVNKSQQEFWNQGVGEIWVSNQISLDAMFARVADLLVQCAAPQPGERVLDIGCGAGATCLLVSPIVASKGSVSGIDISEPMVAFAQERIAAAGFANIKVKIADAQTCPAPEHRFDLAVSRFGLMFFDNPVAAFSNIRAMLKPGARLVFITWASVDHNPWFRLPMLAAVNQLGPPEASDPDAPGPMAFRDRARVTGILEDAGFSSIQSRKIDLKLPVNGGIEGALHLARNVGPIARHLRTKDGSESDLVEIVKNLREMFEPFSGPDGMRVPARINLFEAKSI